MSLARTALARAPLLLLAFAATPLPAAGGASALSFEDRVRAQEAIERVYYAHQTGSRIPFEEAVPRELLERKVRTYLRESAALDAVWHRPVTAEALEHELNRIAAGTRFPDRLQEIYRALGDDAFVIQETFARQALVDRLARRFQAAGGGIGASPAGWDVWSERVRRDLDPMSVPAVADPGARLPGAVTRTKKAWGADDPGALAEAGGSPPGCAPDGTWVNGSLGDYPDNFVAPAVWTGSLMLVWGGGGLLDTGGRYDPLTDTWSPISKIGAPERRVPDALVWTGNEMIVWGGSGVRQDADGRFISLNSGARYDPVSDTWAPMPGSPLFRRSWSAVAWTGHEMIVWGGIYSFFPTEFNDGAAYDPSTDTWRMISSAGAPPPAFLAQAVWTGSEMIVFRGGSFPTSLYDPATDTWRRASGVGGPNGGRATWIGNKLIVWGGSAAQGALYDPATDTWGPISTANAPPPGLSAAQVWTGLRFLVWGGSASREGGRYDPQTDTWTPMSTLGAPDPRTTPVTVWTGQRMIVWGGSVSNGMRPDSGGQYDPVSDSWTPVARSAGPGPVANAPSIWTGNEMIVFNGTSAGGRYDPMTDSWKSISAQGAPQPRSGASVVWSGQEMIVWGGNGGTKLNQPLDDGARYDPVGDTWNPMTTSGAPPARNSAPAVWSGRQMIVWGGRDTSGFLHSGGRYDPAANSWEPMSAPGFVVGESGFSAVWDGGGMIVWGGKTGLDFHKVEDTSAGGRYDPDTDSWTPTTTMGAPTSRDLHSAVWTGQEMLIYGGSHCLLDTSGTYCNDPEQGGRYNPATDTWSVLPKSPSPTHRMDHTAVWTGSAMAVWGGVYRPFSPTDFYLTRDIGTGALYDPATNLWAAISNLDAPSPRRNHVAVWTGRELLIWGGTNNAPLLSGGHYGIGTPSDLDGDGFTACSGDCDETDPAINPLAIDVPGNTIDENCDGSLGPCDPTASWRNAGELNSCIRRECARLVSFGLLAKKECPGK